MATGIIYTLHKRIESLDLQLPETRRTTRMSPPSFSTALVTRDTFYHVDSFTGMNSRLNPFLNCSTQYFLNDSAVGNMGSSMVGVAVTVASGLPDTDKRQAEFEAESTRTKMAYRIPETGKLVRQNFEFCLNDNINPAYRIPLNGKPPRKGLVSEILELGSLGGVDVGGDCRTT
ncbi:hypothetical protein WN944_000397 [Citrus x changshan-huyou]|uniref:Uncharacterized protein n=1 Tax=Citrus x changshan-huyou TaxID=2935761 RepID=A0AAP0QLV9_9ROSI